jgi:hypothetical protein
MVELRLGMATKRAASPARKATMSTGCFVRNGGSVNMIGLRLRPAPVLHLLRFDLLK